MHKISTLPTIIGGKVVDTPRTTASFLYSFSPGRDKHQDNIVDMSPTYSHIARQLYIAFSTAKIPTFTDQWAHLYTLSTGPTISNQQDILS